MTYPPPIYLDETGEPSAWVAAADAPPTLTNQPRNDVHYLATGEQTGGLFGLYRWVFGPARSGPDPHFHRSISESFYILDGTVSIHDGRGWQPTRAGDFLHVPPGGVHGFRNDSGEPASMLLLFTPGAPREEYFETLVEIAQGHRGPMDPEERAEFMLRHDTFWLED
jgi:quercetin dioxygenase-like cupin family protein